MGTEIVIAADVLQGSKFYHSSTLTYTMFTIYGCLKHEMVKYHSS